MTRTGDVPAPLRGHAASIKPLEDNMIGRLIQMRASEAEFDRIMGAVRERVVPAVRQLPGFRADYFAGDATTGRLVSFVIFDTAEGPRAAEELFQRMRPQVEALGLRFESIENLPILVG